MITTKKVKELEQFKQHLDIAIHLLYKDYEGTETVEVLTKLLKSLHEEIEWVQWIKE